MSRLYQALRREMHTQRGAESKKSSDRQLRTGSLKKKSVATGSALFHADPDENMTLWMQKYLGDVRVPREDALRQWLSRPAEFRVHSLPDSGVNTETPTEPVITVVEPAGDRALAHEEISENPTVAADRIPRFIPLTADAPTERTHRIPKLIFRFAMYGVLGILIVKLLWAIPMSRVHSRADSSTTSPRSIHSEVPAIGASAGVSDTSPRSQTSDAPPASSSLPSRVEKLSIGCESERPCIEIYTAGQQVVPQLIALSGPDRLVLDFHGATYSAEPNHIAVGRGSVKGVRVREASGGAQPLNTRVVVDLKMPSDGSLRKLQDKFILDIVPKSAAPTKQ